MSALYVYVFARCIYICVLILRVCIQFVHMHIFSTKYIHIPVAVEVHLGWQAPSGTCKKKMQQLVHNSKLASADSYMLNNGVLVFCNPLVSHPVNTVVDVLMNALVNSLLNTNGDFKLWSIWSLYCVAVVVIDAYWVTHRTRPTCVLWREYKNMHINI